MFAIALLNIFSVCWSQNMSFINSGVSVNDENYIPDFSYAGYHNGNKQIPDFTGTIIDAVDYNVVANDGLDDTKALQHAIREVSKIKGPVTLQLPPGKLIISGIIYIERNNFILSGARPIARKDEDDLIYKTKREKYNAVIDHVTELSQAGRPVLIGTTSVEISELLSRMLAIRKVHHNVLNAKLHKKEADVVAEAGNAGIVTIATNMAGRGTDIKINDAVKLAGGLAIIGTERHDSRRVDRQLRGRAGRQGDPGSSQFYVSLEDNLMRLFGSERISKMMDRMGHKEGEVIQAGMMTRSIERAQKKVEENNFGIRKRLLEYDDVMNAQREVIYKRRYNALNGERLQVDIANMLYETCSEICASNLANKDYKQFEFEIIRLFSLTSPVSQAVFEQQNETELTETVYQAAIAHYQKKMEENAARVFPVVKDVHQNQSNTFKRIVVPFTDGVKTLNVVSDLDKAFESEGKNLIRDFEKNISLAIIDESWKDHLRKMDELKLTHLPL